MFNEDKERRIVPRWRDSVATVATGELAPLPGNLVSSNVGAEFLESKLADWQNYRSVPFAADLVAAAVVLNKEQDVAGAAEFLLENSSTASDAALRLAKRVLRIPTDETRNHDQGHDGRSIFETSQTIIRRLRARLREDPRNALAWVDIARHYSIVGHNQRAKEAIQRGVALAPDNRFVLRSGARFYVHIGDPEIAHHILYRYENTRNDPWLLSAEIAAATVAGKISRLVRRGRQLLGQHSPLQTTELASAIATLELNAGKDRSALKLFKQSLMQPTDNSVAQVEWASQKLNNLIVEQQHLNTPLSFEARALDFYLQGKWVEAHTECLRWLGDEPYSTRPTVLATFISSVALENYAEADRVARWSLKANRNNQLLLNNLTFALASAGNLTEAIKVYREMNPHLFDEGERISWLATGGLLHFRQGNVIEGRAGYQRAIETAKKDQFRSALARAFLAREETLARTPEAQAAYNAAVEAAKAVKLASIATVLSTVLKRTKAVLDAKE